MASRELSQDQINSMNSYLRRQRASGKGPKRVTEDPLGGKGEGLKRAGMGALKYVFDVLDQPKSAITTGLHYAWDDEGKTNPFTGVIEGLTGKTHTSASEILKEDLGIKNKLALALGGFAGDVALDPLTYVGLAPIKGLSTGEKALRATQQAGKLVEEGAIAAEHMPQAVADIAKQLGKENPYKFKVQVGLPGRKTSVGEFNQPEVVNKLREFVKGPEGEARGIVKAFSRKAEQPFGLAEDSRIIEGQMAGDMNRNQRALLRLHNEVSPETRYDAALAYENPKKYEELKNNPLVKRDTVGGLAGRIMGLGREGPSALMEAREGGINTIGEYVDYVREHRRILTEAEMEAGMNRHLLPREPDRTLFQGGKKTKVKGRVREWDELADYERGSILDGENKLLPKHVRKPKELDIVRGLNRQLGKAGETYLSPHMMPFEGPNGLMSTRADPIIDIGESHIMGMANSFRDQTRAQITRRALETLGIKADSLEGQQMLANLAAKESMGIRWTKVQQEGANALRNEIAQHADFKDMVIPDSIQRLLNTQEEILTSDDLGSAFMQHFDRVMGHWKALNTTLNPGYMTRNAVGDVIANFADGVYDPRRYVQAHQVLGEIKKNDVIDLAETLRNPTESLRSFPNLKAPSDVAVHIGGRAHTPREIFHAGTANGIFSGDIITEKMKGAITADTAGKVLRGRETGNALKFSNIKDTLDQNIKQTSSNALGLAEAKMADVNIARETNQRYAHFIDRYDKEVTQGLKDYAKEHRLGSRNLTQVRAHMGEEAAGALEAKAAATAAERVRKYNIDYGSLSSFEQKYMKRLIPFYSFFRKNAPLQMSMLFTKPGFMNAYPKSIEAVQNMIGTNDGNGDWMVPDWVRESMPIRLAQAGVQGNIVSQIAKFASGASDDTTVFLPMMQGLMPAGDVGTVLSPIQRAVDTGSPWQGAAAAGQEALNMATPPIKMLSELGHKTNTLSGAKITDWPQWAVSSTLGTPGRLAYTMSPFGTKDKMPAVTSAVLGPQLRSIDQETQQGEFQRRRNLSNAQTKQLRREMASKLGIDENEEAFGRLSNYEISQILYYMKEAGRSVGTYG